MSVQKPEIRIAVTGGRDFKDEKLVSFVFCNLELFYLKGKYEVTLIHGAADGLDTLASKVATRIGWTPKPYPITKEDWKTKGKKAGPERNAVMLTDSKPHILLSFPGGRGTANCIQTALDLKIPVVSFYNAPLLTLFGKIDQAWGKITERIKDSKENSQKIS